LQHDGLEAVVKTLDRSRRVAGHSIFQTSLPAAVTVELKITPTYSTSQQFCFKKKILQASSGWWIKSNSNLFRGVSLETGYMGYWPCIPCRWINVA
jgi:hypothetical protein